MLLYYLRNLFSNIKHILKALFNNNAFLHETEMDAPESVINTIEDKIPVNDIVRFLGKLQAKTEELLLTPACRAEKNGGQGRKSSVSYDLPS